LERQTRDAKRERETRPAAGLSEAIRAPQSTTNDAVASTSTTPKKRNDIYFGEQSPLSRNAPKLPPPNDNAEQHTKRWASYSSLPAAFEPGTAEVAELAGKEDEKISAPKPNKMSLESLCNKETEEKTPISSVEATFAYAACSGKPTAVSAAQELKAVIDAADERRAHLGRLRAANDFVVPDFVLSVGDDRSPEEMRLARYSGNMTTGEAHVKPSRAADVMPLLSTSEYTPLFSHFNERLSKLSSSNNPAAVLVEADHAPSVPDSTTSSESLLLFPPSSITKNVTNGTIALPEERLADSIKSILSGMSQLTAAFTQSKVELNNTLNLARQDFPHGLKEAIRAGASAVDAFRGVPQKAAVIGELSSAEPAPLTNPGSTDLNASASSPAAVTSDDDIASTAPEKIANRDYRKWTPDFIDARRSLSYNTRDGAFEPVHEYLVQWLDRPREHGMWICNNRPNDALKHLMDEFDQMLDQQTQDENVCALAGYNIADGMAANLHNATIGLCTEPIGRLTLVKRKNTTIKEASKPSQSFMKKIQDASQARRAARVTDPVVSTKLAERTWTTPEDNLLRELLAGKTHMQLHDWRTWAKVAGKFLNRPTDTLKMRWEVIKTDQLAPDLTIAVQAKPKQKKELPIWALDSMQKNSTTKGDELTGTGTTLESVLETRASAHATAHRHRVTSPEDCSFQQKFDKARKSVASGGLPQADLSQAEVKPGRALADYEMQLMLLETQNKRRLALAHQEQSSIAPHLPVKDKPTNTDGCEPAHNPWTASVLPPPSSSYDTTKYANTMLAPIAPLASFTPHPLYSSTLPNRVPPAYGSSFRDDSMPPLGVHCIQAPSHGSYNSTFNGSTLASTDTPAPRWSHDHTKSQLDHWKAQQKQRQWRGGNMHLAYSELFPTDGVGQSDPDEDFHGFPSNTTVHLPSYDWQTAQLADTLFDRTKPLSPPARLGGHLVNPGSSSFVGGAKARLPSASCPTRVADTAVSGNMTSAQRTSTSFTSRPLPSPLTGLVSKTTSTKSKIQDTRPNGSAEIAPDAWSSSEWMPQWPTLQYSSTSPAFAASSISAASTNGATIVKDAMTTWEDMVTIKEAVPSPAATIPQAPGAASSHPSTSFRLSGSGPKLVAPDLIPFDTYLNKYGTEADNFESVRPTQAKAPRSPWVARCIKDLTEMGYAPAEKVEEISEACEGDLDAAMNLMEEDAAEWKRRSKGKDVMREDEPYVGNEERWSWRAFEQAEAKKDLDSWDERKMPGGFDAWNGA
jgi:hypothetical protein